MTKDEIKNRISMALKDPVLQQGFEIICKENANFIEENKKLRGQFFELKSKIVDLIYSDENCLDKIIELLDDFELELEEDEE